MGAFFVSVAEFCFETVGDTVYTQIYVILKLLKPANFTIVPRFSN